MIFLLSLTDVGGSSGILLSHILNALRGVLADVSHVLERARQLGYPSGDLAWRATMQPCDFFEAIPSGTRAYLMKSVITIGMTISPEVASLVVETPEKK